MKFKQVDDLLKAPPKGNPKIRNFGRVVLPTHLVKNLYFNNDIDSLLMGSLNHPFGLKLESLKSNLLELGWRPNTDFIYLSFEDGNYLISNGQRRMIMAKALSLPYVTCNLLCVYSTEEERTKIKGLLQDLKSYNRAVHPKRFVESDFNKLKEMKREAHQRNIWRSMH